MSELRERLTRLLDEAREAGALAELGDLLDGASLEAHAKPTARGEVDVPMRCGMVGDSAPMHAVWKVIENVATSDVAVLVQGETGTGKELVARAIHDLSRRRSKPFLAENCAAVAPNLLESELFGHTKGSFTGAIADRKGHFVAADGGTIFLDEIGDMPRDMQSKLLRVLELSEVRPVGSNKTITVDVRVVAATNRDLATMIAERTFRQDLFYRLNVVRIELPPLRERSGDVRHLVRYFLAGAVEIEEDALLALEAYPWPGNVRQLENEIKRATALTNGTIGLADLGPDVRAAYSKQ